MSHPPSGIGNNYFDKLHVQNLKVTYFSLSNESFHRSGGAFIERNTSVYSDIRKFSTQFDFILTILSAVLVRNFEKLTTKI